MKQAILSNITRDFSVFLRNLFYPREVILQIALLL